MVFEKAAELGGTWRENTYPGLICDVPSHALYRSSSFAPNPRTGATAIRRARRSEAYMKDVARRFDVERLIRFSSEVTGAAFEGGAWRIATTQGDQGLFDAVITAAGVLHHPNYPDIAWAWPTSPSASPSTLRAGTTSVSAKGKRVGIMGTGSDGDHRSCRRSWTTQPTSACSSARPSG